MNIPDEAVQAAEEAVYARHERGFLMKPLVDPIDMRAALTAALPFLTGVKVDVTDIGNPITLVYTNYRGETSERIITPIKPWFGSTEWHPEPQWFLTAFDHEKQANRDFALKDFGYPAPSQRAQALEEELFDEMTRRFGNKKYIWETSEDHYPNPKYLPFDDTQIGVEFALEFLKPYLSALSSQHVADGWLPIETAPKDGTVLAWCENAPPQSYKVQAVRVRNGEFLTSWTPTHWRPLPASPGASV